MSQNSPFAASSGPAGRPRRNLDPQAIFRRLREGGSPLGEVRSASPGPALSREPQGQYDLFARRGR